MATFEASTGSPERIGSVRNVAVEGGTALLATLLVSALPAVAATRLVESRDALAVILSAALAVILSVLTARVGSVLWSYNRRSGEVLFSDLMLWSWLRRRWNERRLAALQGRLFGAGNTESSMSLKAVIRFGRLLEERDAFTYGHSRRVARYTRNIARGLHLDADAIEKIRQAALVHDIGKLHTPRSILTKAGPLTDEEFAIVKRHAADGAAMLADIGDHDLVAIVRHHHERLDGLGYPDGLRSQQIPLGARIIAVADTFDALTSARTYRGPATHKKALTILTAVAGTQLDPIAVNAFQRHYMGRRPVAVAAAIGTASERMLAWITGGSASVGNTVGSLAQTLPALAAAATLATAPGLSGESGVGADGRTDARYATTVVAKPSSPTRRAAGGNKPHDRPAEGYLTLCDSRPVQRRKLIPDAASPRNRRSRHASGHHARRDHASGYHARRDHARRDHAGGHHARRDHARRDDAGGDHASGYGHSAVHHSAISKRPSLAVRVR